MSNPGGEGQVPLPEPLDLRDNPKVLTVEDLEKAALGGDGGGGGTGAGGGGDGGGQENRQTLNLILLLTQAQNRKGLHRIFLFGMKGSI